jgi:hypothetical protein
MSRKIFSLLDPEDFTIPALQKIAKELILFIAKPSTEGGIDSFLESLPAELRSVADQLYLFASGLSEMEHELIWNIVYEIKENSCRKWYSYYSQRDDEESAKKAQHYKELRNTLSKTEMEKLFTKV